jgi:hypothetical protein
LGTGVLSTEDRFGIGEPSEGFVAFGREEQALKLASNGITLIALGKERVEVRGVGFEGFRCGRNRQSATHADPPPPVLTYPWS